MLVLSTDPDVAQEQMSGIIFYLVTFGYIDGHFDPSEMAFIKDVIRQVVEYRVDHPPEGAEPGDRDEQIALYAGYFEDMLKLVEEEVIDLMHESVTEEESHQDFVTSKLRQRCFETFGSFDEEQQKLLISALNGLLWADGEAHPAELKLRHELSDLLNHTDGEEAPTDRVLVPRHMKITELDALPHEPSTHDYFKKLERHLPGEGFDGDLGDELARDQAAVLTLQTLLRQQRRLGRGKLDGIKRVDDLSGMAPFLQEHVWVLPPHPVQSYELTVIGDLHGCYSCLKAAIQQSAFLERLEAYRADPMNAPNPKLVLMGDYLDRGRFGFDGVLRLALRLVALAPDHVHLLRGNHEDFFVDPRNDRVDSAVRPAESIEAFRKVAPPVLLLSYRDLFNALPHVLIFGRILFTHGGIPADGVVENADRDLPSLNEPMTAFQMRWSDPSIADVIPRKLQSETYRFGFGRLQAQAFLQQLGCHTLIRGHEKIEQGFERKFDDDHVQLLTLFSAGGEDNEDLPETSSYRRVRPMALTIRHEGGLDGNTEIDAWPIDYAPYNDARYNAFYADPKAKADAEGVAETVAEMVAEATAEAEAEATAEADPTSKTDT